MAQYKECEVFFKEAYALSAAKFVSPLYNVIYFIRMVNMGSWMLVLKIKGIGFNIIRNKILPLSSYIFLTNNIACSFILWSTLRHISYQITLTMPLDNKIEKI